MIRQEIANMRKTAEHKMVNSIVEVFLSADEAILILEFCQH